jgi:type I restriction enzyme S subunit
VTFEVREDVTLGPEYLMLMLRRAEFDRFAWFVSDSSVRGGLEWARFLEIKIPIARDAAQRDSVVKLAANINALQASLTTSEIKLEHVLEACMSAQAKEHKLKPIGSLIEKCERRGSGLEKKHVRGISINKQFIKTKANLTNVDVSEYKVVAKDEFAYVTVTSRNGDKVSLAMNYGEDLIVSKTYEVFRVKPGVDLLPEYLMLWFRRPDFDRYARFHSWGSARETFDWPEMCRVEVPLPDLLAQSAVVKILRSLNQRRQSLQDLKNAQVKTARVLYSGLMAGGDLGSA